MIGVPQIAMLGLNLLNSGAKYAMGQKNLKTQKKLGKAQHQHQLNQARRFVDQTGEDNQRGRRQLEEALFARGLGDSSILENDMAYYNRGANRRLEGARESLSLAGKGMSAFKKQLKQQKMANFLDLGMGLANAGLGAWAMGSQAPRPQMPRNIGPGMMMGGLFGGAPGAAYGAGLGMM
jgi:hypothetical protein